MKTLILAALTASIASAAMAQQTVRQPTGVDVPGCTFYKIIDNKVICSATWKEGYKANLKKSASE